MRCSEITENLPRGLELHGQRQVTKILRKVGPNLRASRVTFLARNGVRRERIVPRREQQAGKLTPKSSIQNEPQRLEAQFPPFTPILAVSGSRIRLTA